VSVAERPDSFDKREFMYQATIGRIRRAFRVGLLLDLPHRAGRSYRAGVRTVIEHGRQAE